MDVKLINRSNGALLGNISRADFPVTGSEHVNSSLRAVTPLSSFDQVVRAR